MEFNHINEEFKYNFENNFSVLLILNQTFQFLDKDNIEYLALCNKKIYRLYCEQVIKIKINKEADKLNLQTIIYKYDNIYNLDLSDCKKIKDFTPISKLERLQIINFNNKCIDIKDFTPISNLERLEFLDVNLHRVQKMMFL